MVTTRKEMAHNHIANWWWGGRGLSKTAWDGRQRDSRLSRQCAIRYSGGCCSFSPSKHRPDDGVKISARRSGQRLKCVRGGGSVASLIVCRRVCMGKDAKVAEIAPALVLPTAAIGAHIDLLEGDDCAVILHNLVETFVVEGSGSLCGAKNPPDIGDVRTAVVYTD